MIRPAAPAAVLVGAEGAWQKLMQGARYLGRYKNPDLEIHLHPLLTGINAGPGLVDLVPLAAEVGAARIDFQATHCSHLSEEQVKEIALSPRQIEEFQKEYLPKILELGERYGIQVEVEGGNLEELDFENFRYPLKEDLSGVRLSSGGDHALGYYQQPGHTCYTPWYHCLINYNGNVFACCCMRDKTTKIGNIVDSSLVDVLRGDAARRLRLRLTTENIPRACTECTSHIMINQAIDQLLTG